MKHLEASVYSHVQDEVFYVYFFINVLAVGNLNYTTELCFCSTVVVVHVVAVLETEDIKYWVSLEQSDLVT